MQDVVSVAYTVYIHFLLNVAHKGAFFLFFAADFRRTSRDLLFVNSSTFGGPLPSCTSEELAKLAPCCESSDYIFEEEAWSQSPNGLV